MTDLSPLGLAALEYAARGWHVFPLRPGEKIPLIPERMGGKGFLDATTDAAKIRRWWTVTPNANIGIGLIQSGLVVIDADTYKPECGWAAFIAGRDLPDTLIQRSANGGTHYVFRARPGVEYPGKLARFVDVRWKGYIVAEPSVLGDAAYQWQTDDEPALAPAWMERPPAPEAVESTGVRAATDDPRVQAYVERAVGAELAALRVAMPGERNNVLNTAAFAIGQFVGAGHLEEADAQAMLVEAMQECGIPADERKALGTIKSGLTAGQKGPRTIPMDDEPPFDHDRMAKVLADIEAAFDRKDRDAAQAIVADLMQPQEPARAIWAETPSFGSETRRRLPPPVSWMNEAEFRRLFPAEQPAFPVGNYVADLPGLLGALSDYLDCASATATEAGGLAVALPLLGAVMGRGYASPTDLRTNLYSVAIGASGTGKTSLVNPAKEVLAMAKAGHLLGADSIKSGSGLMKMLTVPHAKICFLDEFGHTLQKITNIRAGSHEREILTEFTRLYSAANTIYTGAAMATASPAPIDCPHLCLFGMATPDQFWDAFGSGALEDGTVARYIVMPIGQSAPKEPDKREAEGVALAIADVLAAMDARRGANLYSPPVVAAMAVRADDARMALVRTMDAAATWADENGIRGGPAILRRVAENATKIALVSAVGRDPKAPVISTHDFAIGHALAVWSAGAMIGNIASRVADNDHERNALMIERVVREAGAEGVTKQTLISKTRKIEKRTRDNILADLIEAEIVVQEVVRTATKPRTTLRHIATLKPSGGA